MIGLKNIRSLRSPRFEDSPGWRNRMFRSNLNRRAEVLERWSARATLAILAGITIEIGILIWYPHPYFWETVATAAANILIGAGLAAEYVVILRLSAAKRRTSNAFVKRLADIEACATEANRRALAAQLAVQMLRQSQGAFDPALHQLIRINSDDRSGVVLPATMTVNDQTAEATRHAACRPG